MNPVREFESSRTEFGVVVVAVRLVGVETSRVEIPAAAFETAAGDLNFVDPSAGLSTGEFQIPTADF